jgi:hypothetical protein
MPKNRKRVAQSGAKSIAIQTKHKVGGRKSGKGAKQMSTNELNATLARVRKRDRNKLRRSLEDRGIIPPM